MRIDIKTKKPVKDNDIRALYLIKKALEISSPHMVDANIRFAVESFKSNLKTQPTKWTMRMLRKTL